MAAPLSEDFSHPCITTTLIVPVVLKTHKVKGTTRKRQLKLKQIKGVSFQRNCGAASVGVLQDNLVLSTE